MKMFRRLASFVVVLSMVLAMLPATVSAATLPEDVKGTAYEDAASLLCALEIMVGDGNKFNPDNNVTRAEFAKILVTTMGHLDAANSFAAQGKFDDVPTSEWYAPFVEFAAQFGAINGYGDGKFGPNDNVTGYQAIKMISYASGHNVCVDDPIGGYPQEYFNVAKEYNFLKGLSNVNFSMPMTRGQVAILTANVLKADMLKLVASGDKSEYQIMEDVNLLSQKHDVYLFEGLVTSNEKTGLFSASTVMPGKVQIEKGAVSKVFNVGESDIDEEIGTYVKAYYQINDNEGTETVIAYDIPSTKNTKIDTVYDAIDIDESTNTAVRYWKDVENKDVKSTKIEIGDATIIWNGAISSYTKVMDAIEAAEGAQSKIQFMDYDGDNKMDIVSIKAYKTYVVSNIDSDNYIITDEYKNKVTLDVEDEASFISITDVDGEEYTFEDIAVGDVLSVAISEDGSVADVIISMDTIEGSVGSIGRSNGKMVIEIDGEDYALTAEYLDYVTDGDEDAAVADMKVKIGKTYEFKLDVFGQLAFSDTASGSATGDFGFITTYAQAQNADASINVRMFSAGSIAIYGLADTVEIDGDKCKGTAEIITVLDEIKEDYIPAGLESGGYYGDGAWNGVPVLFELNDDGLIKYIDTPTVGDNEDKYTLQFSRNQPTGKIFESKYSSSAFGSSNPLASDLSVIQLPSNIADINIASKYSTSKSFNTSTQYYVQLLSTDPESYTANYAIIARGAKGSKDTSFETEIDAGLDDAETVNGGNDHAGIKTTPLFVVSGVMRTIVGEDEEETIIISGIENGAEVSYTVDPDYYATGYIMKTLEKYISSAGTTLSESRTNQMPIMEGDVLRLARNKTTKYVTFVAPVFYMAEKALYAYTNGGYLTNNNTVYCAIDLSTVSEMDGTQGVMSYFIKNNNKSVYGGLVGMDENGRIVPPINAADVEEGKDTDTTDVIKTDDGYTGTFTRMFNIGGFSKIALYDASEREGERVSKGSINDIITLEDATNKTNPSLVLFHYRTGINYSMVIINL